MAMEVQPAVFLLIVLFGMGSWVAINGVWAELPLLVSSLPEGWNLPTYLVLIIQGANVGPILFTFLRQYKQSCASLKYGAYLILVTGFTASLLLSQLWHREIQIGTKHSSVPLLCLSFMFALLDCTSSVVFLPYMAKYPPGYMIAFYIGEGMSGVAPSMLALSQGAGGDTCSNATDTNQPGPRFSVGLYFGLLSILLATSGVAFYLLNTLQLSLSERYTAIMSVSSHSTQHNTPQQSVQYLAGTRQEPDISVERSPSSKSPPHSPKSDSDAQSGLRVYDVFFGERKAHYASIRMVFIQLYVLTAVVCAFGNGVIPAILSYACLPYGPTTYHLATELSLLANPLSCFIAFFVACKSPLLLDALGGVAVLIASTILYIATLSPDPWLAGTTAGSFLIVGLCVAWTATISYIKVCIASVLQKYGENALLWCGVVTQLGSCCGAVVIFIINFNTDAFTQC